MRLVQGVCQPLHLLDGREDGRVIGADGNVLHVGLEGVRLLDVLRDIDQHGAGLTRRSDEEGFRNHAWQFVDRAHEEVVLRHAPRNAGGVGFLEGVGADQAHAHLPGDDHEGHAVHHRGGKSRNRIGRAGPGGY